MPEPAADRATSVAPSTVRLVIRVKITPEGSSRAPVRQRLSRSGLALVVGAVAVLLSWVGVSMFRTHPTSAPAATEVTPTSASQSPALVPAPSEAAPVVKDAPLPKPATETVETAELVQPAATSPINEAIPDVPQSARATIRGTVRVSVRVIVDKKGTVLAATADDPGPSRYFERLAIESAKQWTFTPAASEEQRIMVVRFNFTRAGTTAHANTLQ